MYCTVSYAFLQCCQTDELLEHSFSQCIMRQTGQNTHTRGMVVLLRSMKGWSLHTNPSWCDISGQDRTLKQPSYRKPVFQYHSSPNAGKTHSATSSVTLMLWASSLFFSSFLHSHTVIWRRLVVFKRFLYRLPLFFPTFLLLAARACYQFGQTFPHLTAHTHTHPQHILKGKRKTFSFVQYHRAFCCCCCCRRMVSSSRTPNVGTRRQNLLFPPSRIRHRKAAAAAFQQHV